MISILRRTIRNTGAVLNSSVLCRRVSQSVSMDHSLALFSVIQSLMFLLSLHYTSVTNVRACEPEPEPRATNLILRATEDFFYVLADTLFRYLQNYFSSFR